MAANSARFTVTAISLCRLARLRRQVVAAGMQADGQAHLLVTLQPLRAHSRISAACSRCQKNEPTVSGYC